MKCFAKAASLKDFVATDPAAWKLRLDTNTAIGSLDLVAQSQYAPPVRSPVNIALLADRAFGDFVLDADVMQTGREYGHRDFCLFFGVQDPTNFYYVHLASNADDYAHNVFIVHNAPRTRIAHRTTTGIDWGTEVWHRIRVERRLADGQIRGRIEVYAADQVSTVTVEGRAGWDRVSNENGIMDYDGDGYRMVIKKPGYNIWSTPEKNFGDVRIEADVFRLNGPQENRAGLMCRYQNGDYYFFIITNDGYYAVGKFIGGQTLLLGQAEMQTSDFIQKQAVNHLRAHCVGNTLTFYINGFQVASAQDDDFANGDVGLLAGAFPQPGVDVLFDHFTVLQP